MTKVIKIFYYFSLGCRGKQSYNSKEPCCNENCLQNRATKVSYVFYKVSDCLKYEYIDLMILYSESGYFSFDFHIFERMILELNQMDAKEIIIKRNKSLRHVNE